MVAVTSVAESTWPAAISPKARSQMRARFCVSGTVVRAATKVSPATENMKTKVRSESASERQQTWQTQERLGEIDGGEVGGLDVVRQWHIPRNRRDRTPSLPLRQGVPEQLNLRTVKT